MSNIHDVPMTTGEAWLQEHEERRQELRRTLRTIRKLAPPPAPTKAWLDDGRFRQHSKAFFDRTTTMHRGR